MKRMTCRELGGACDHEFFAETFEEMAELSKKHGMEMFQKNDNAHLAAMQKMKVLMDNPEQMNVWFAQARAKFNSLPDVK